MPNPPTAPLTFYPAYCFPLSATHNTWARLTTSEVYALTERSGFEGQNLYFYLNHPIKWVRLVGLIVSFEAIPTRFILILDDSSGATIEVTCARKAPSAPAPLAKGSGVAAIETDAWGFLKWVDKDRLATTTNAIATTRDPGSVAEMDMRGETATGQEVDLQNVEIGSVVKIKGGIREFRGQRQISLERLSIVRSTAEETAAWAENSTFRREVLDRPWVLGVEELEAAKKEAEGLERERELIERRRNRKKKRKALSEKKIGKGTGRGLQMNGTMVKITEEEAMKRIEEEDAQRRQREEAARKMKGEQERKRKEEEERKRKDDEERERLAAEMRRRNEAREKALREMGAGR